MTTPLSPTKKGKRERGAKEMIKSTKESLNPYTSVNCLCQYSCKLSYKVTVMGKAQLKL